MDNAAETENAEEIEESEQTVAGDIDSITDDLLNNAPGVSEHVIEQEQAKETEQTESLSQYPGFDPVIHATDENGQPIPKKGGGWQKRRGKKSGSVSNTKPTVQSQLGKINANSGPSTKELAAREAGRAAAGMIFQAGMLLGGEEWQPLIDSDLGINEPVTMAKAWGDYFVAKDIEDFPPGIALSIALIGYAVPRLTQPKTKTRLQRLGLWVKEKLANRKKKKPQVIEKQEEK